MIRGQKVRLGLVQSAASTDCDANLSNSVAKARLLAKRGAQIICLPELYRIRYFPQYSKMDVSHLAESIPGESTEAFSRLARECGVVILVPIFEKEFGGKFYNSAVVIDADGRRLPTYRKIHVPQDPLFYEKNYFQEGDGGFRVFQTRYARIAPLICYDQWFPEAARIATLQGADILFYPTAIGRVRGLRPSEGDWRDAWIAVQRGHAIANGVHVVAVNRVGREGELEFWGSSFVSDAFGKVLKQAGQGREQALLVDVDLAQNKAVREGWGFLRNRRPDLYGSLAEGRKKRMSLPLAVS